MDTPKSEILGQALQNDEIEKIPSDIAKKLEKFCESRNEESMMTKVLLDTTHQNNETLRHENEQLTSKTSIIEAENEALKLTVTDLNGKVEANNAEVIRLAHQMAQQETDLSVYRKEKNDLVDERDLLLKITDRKDGHIVHLNGVVKHLEEQLQSAVGAKYEALARLDEIEGKEQTLGHKERQIEMEKELLNSEIASLRDNLNRCQTELTALRTELTLATVQYEIDLKQKTEELRTANSTINHLTEANQSLTTQCEENIQKLRDQMTESSRLMDHYQNELDAKIKLADLYKEHSDDYQAQANEISSAVKELQRMLNETTDQCGVFETKLKECNEQHQFDLDEKDETIARLKQELKVANEMLEKADEENSERIVENYMPSANAMHRRLQSGLTFTEICTRYFNLVEQVKVKDQDYNNLKLQFETVYQDIQEKAPEVERLHVEYKKAIALNEELTSKIDDFISERVVIREELTNNRSKFGHLERENIKLKASRTDLARQVCYLLNEIECNRGGTSSDQEQSIASDMPANEVISNKLVTFNNIIEMQENNQKLLLLVRDFSTKLEEMEEIQNSIDIETYESKCASYEKRLQDAEQSRRANEELLANCLKEKERYKQMVCDLMKDCNKSTPGDHSMIGQHIDAMDVGDASGVNGSLGGTQEAKDKKLADIEQKLEDKVKQLKELRDEYNEYRNESKSTTKSLNEQYLAVRNELRELTTANCKLLNQSNFVNEQIKTQQNNVAIYKNKIQSLEERNQTYEKTIAKHETAGKYMRDEAVNTMKKLSTLETRCDHLQRENSRLMDAYRNLQLEHQLLISERKTNSILQNNLEMIKGSFERFETDGRAKMEQRLDDASRECSALRRRLQEEQDYYRVQIATIKSQTEGSQRKINDQLLEVETLRSQLKCTQEQIELKNQQINELSQKLQNSSSVSYIDVPVACDNAKIKELEVQVINAAAEVQKLRSEISLSAEREARLRQVATEWEEEVLKLKDTFDTCKTKMSVDLEAAQLSETQLKAKVDELQTEIRLQVMETDSSMFDTDAENNARVELKEALKKIDEKDRELRDLRSECNQLKIDLQTIEQKYSNEMQAHSSDLQTLAMCKDELNKCQEQIDQVVGEKDKAIEILKTNELEWEKANKKLNEDKMELEQKLEYLDQQNTALHDQLQAQHNKAGSSNDSMSESFNNSFLNRSLTDDESKEVSSDKLLKVIMFLRKEKDCSVTKVEILKNENTRLLSEIELLKKRLGEQSLQLNAVKSPMNAPNVVSAKKYEELMRKVETLNAVTESNIHLRTEKEALAAKEKDLSERIVKLEDELAPLQEKNRELLAKTEEQMNTNQMLRKNYEDWRKRASDLVERNNKNPEDFMRLQKERENVARMLTAEKENLRHVNDELNSMKSEKIKTEQELAASLRQLHTTTDEKKKAQDDLNVLKQQNARLTQEIIEIKSQILKKEDEIKAVQNELISKDSQLTDIKNKEVQIRRIAKKYKDSYYELKSEKDNREADLAAKSLEEQAEASTVAGSAGLAAARIELEKAQTKKLEDLSNQLLSRQEEIEQLRKEIENLKKQDDKNLLADARNRIAALTEQNRQISRDFQSSKNQLQTCEQSRSEHDSVVAALKSQLEAKIKELFDQDATRQETIARLTRENETLNTRVNQLHRQFQQQGSKPSTSSGTIEKSPSDAARTANVKPMATPSAQQSATVNPRRGGDTPLASIRPMSVQNSRTAAVLPTSQTSNVVAVQGSSTGNVTTALVPPQQQVHTTGNTATAEAMSSSPTSSHTDYMPATSSAVVLAVPPMASTSAESTQEAESLSVNTNESSSSSSTSSQAVLQQQTVALVSPRVEVAPQNIVVPSQQVLDQNQAASTSGSSSSFQTTMSTHHQASSSNTVTTTQAGGHKRPRDAEGDSSTVEESSASEKTSPQNKRTRQGEQTFQGVSESGLDVEYQVPTSSQRDQEDDVVAVDSEDDDDDDMDDVAAVDVDENFEGDNGDTDEIESFGQDEGEGNDIDEDNVPNDNNEVDVDDSSDAPNQSSSGAAVSSGVRVNLGEVIELPPLGQETQQIQTISSGSDAGPSVPANLWRQAQTPTRQQHQQQQQQQQNLVIQQAYEEVADDSIVPSTPTLYVTRRAGDGFSEAVSSPHPTVPIGTRFTFGDSGSSHVNRIVVPGSSIEGMDDTRVELNMMDGSGDNGQSSSVNTPALQTADNQQIVVVVDLSDDNSNENNQADQPIAGPSRSAEGSLPQIMVTDAETEDNNFDESASTSQLIDDKNATIDTDAQDEEDVDTDGVSSGQDGMQVEEGREAEASPQMTTDKRTTRQTRHKEDTQRLTPIVWDGDGREQQTSPQNRGISNRGALNRGQTGRGGRGRGKRPFHS